jgi:hypothetical protein
MSMILWGEAMSSGWGIWAFSSTGSIIFFTAVFYAMGELSVWYCAPRCESALHLLVEITLSAFLILGALALLGVFTGCVGPLLVLLAAPFLIRAGAFRGPRPENRARWLGLEEE